MHNGHLLPDAGLQIRNFKAGTNEKTLLHKHFVPKLFTALLGWANKRKAKHFSLLRHKLLLLFHHVLHECANNVRKIKEHSKSVFL